MSVAGDDLALITEAALEAGDLAQALRRQGLEIDYKAGGSPVTNADLAADALLKQRLREARPDYGWLSEETVDDTARLDAACVFVVDPIDGTRAFLKSRPWWTVCIAVVVEGRPHAGVVVAPELSETYTARRRGGARLNGRQIEVSGADTLDECGMVGDPAMFAHPDWPQPWPSMRVQPRNSTAYRMCLVAGGLFDATVAMAPKADWDLAAADLIAAEAGAFVGDHQGQAFAYNGPVPQQPSLVCAAPGVAPLILDRVRNIALPRRANP